MKKLVAVVTAIPLFYSTLAVANNCPANSSDWAATEQNLRWTIILDAAARSCYFNDGNNNAYDRMKDCNDGFKANANQMQDKFNRCWPDNVCNWVRANGAPGC
jgi:hypothetical protein